MSANTQIAELMTMRNLTRQTRHEAYVIFGREEKVEWWSFPESTVQTGDALQLSVYSWIHPDSKDERIAVGHTIVPTVTSLYNGSIVAVQVHPTKDKATGKMNMEGVFIDEQGTWHKAKIDGSREVLRDDAGNPIRNGSKDSASSPRTSSPQAGPTPASGTGEKAKPEAESKPAEQKKVA